MSDSQIGTIVVGIVPTVIFHPIAYFRTLTQLGYEPLTPYQSNAHPWPIPSKRRVWYYPNVFKYLRHIREEDGFFGMYRGLGPRLCSTIINNITVKKVSAILNDQGIKPEEIKPTDAELEAWQKIVKKNCVDSLTQSAGVIISYPFHVVMVRSMAQFIGKEHLYDNTFYSFGEINNSEGISGFFCGLIPRLLGEVFTIWLTNTLVFVVQRYVLKEKKDEAVTGSFTKAISSLMASAATYPFFAVSTIMIVNGCPSLTAGVEPLGRRTFEHSWKKCLEHLKKHRAQARGSSLFWRKCPVTQID